MIRHADHFAQSRDLLFLADLRLPLAAEDLFPLRLSSLPIVVLGGRGALRSAGLPTKDLYI
jgi:hypothetical protein